MQSGMNVQVSSRISEPWMGAPTSLASRRRKRTAKTTTSVATSTEKKAVTAMKNRYSASTLAACVEPCGGKNGRCDSIAVRKRVSAGRARARRPSPSSCRCGGALTAPHDRPEHQHGGDHQDAGGLHETDRQQAVG